MQAAGEIFASRGFRAATVREICRKAGVNVAAINYYFGNKEQLYLEVWRYSHRCALEKFPHTHGLAENETPEKKLEAFIRAFLLRIFEHGEMAWFGKLISREMIEPTPGLDTLVHEEITPQLFMVRGLVEELVGKKISKETLRLCVMSIISQCVFYHHCQPVIHRLFPMWKFTPAEIEKVAAHISRFSLAALKEMS